MVIKNTYLQLAQIITGALVGILLTIHMVVMHLDAILGFFGIVNDTSWSSMMIRARQGIWAGIYIALLAFGLFHALNGLRNILMELNLSPRAERILTWFMIAIGLIFLAVGTYVPLALLGK